MRLFDIRSLAEIVLDQSNGTSADVVVVVPLYNYEEHIIECLDSVVGQTIEHLSVIVVDDCSEDNGLHLVTEFLKSHVDRFSSARVVRHRKNLGLSIARNSGIAWSSEPLLFMLDADNRIRPPALERLKNALVVCGADFAYSQLFIFGDVVRIGDTDIWHVDRLAHGNTIDAMAMIRRTALTKAGGYAVLADDFGWEDYDLWCRFYTMGFRGVFVPELLCEYRRHASSMLHSRTNRNLAGLQAEMALRYPEIFNRQARITPLEDDYSVAVPLQYTTGPLDNPPRIAVVIHMFVAHLADEIMGYVGNIPYPVDVFISTDTEEKERYIRDRLRSWPGSLDIRVTSGRGRDIAPRLLGFKDIYKDYEFALLLHSKASSHAAILRNWREHLLGNLVGSREVVESILEIFGRLPDIGIVAGQHLEEIREWLGWGDNFELSKALGERFGVKLQINSQLDYPSGSMLWARTAALRPFLDALDINDFTSDIAGSQLDGTMAHAVERLFFIAAEAAGLSWVKVAEPRLFENKDQIEHANNPLALHTLIMARRRHLLQRATSGHTETAS